MSKKVVIGMSGGVDSSVAAALLVQRGYQVIGLFMNNWRDDGHCPAAADWVDVQAVCGRLGIPHYSVNFAEQYYQQVFVEFLEQYRLGNTPNPDVLCNRHIKFGVFADYARTLGADLIATGHYAAWRDGQLHRAADSAKDQTYFLNQVTTDQLQDVLFPLAQLQKSEVRAIATRLGLVTDTKRDSTGICFVGERDFRTFLAQFFVSSPGPIQDLSGAVVGQHIGLQHYTIGQRRGLDIGGVPGRSGRWYVVSKDLAANVLVVDCGSERSLMSQSLVADNLNFIGQAPPARWEGTARTRYRQPDTPVTVEHDGQRAWVRFLSPQRAVTVGQYVVWYQGSRCLGGGRIIQVT